MFLKTFPLRTSITSSSSNVFCCTYSINLKFEPLSRALLRKIYQAFRELCYHGEVRLWQLKFAAAPYNPMKNTLRLESSEEEEQCATTARESDPGSVVTGCEIFTVRLP